MTSGPSKSLRPGRVGRDGFTTMRCVIRRSVYTILLLTLAATAGLATMSAGQVGLILSLACAGIGVVICGIAWASPIWRSGAGPVRHAMVTIAGLACLALVTMNVRQLMF